MVAAAMAAALSGCSMIPAYERPAAPDGMYAKGARYLLDWECPWFPVVESCLRLDESRAVQELEPTA